MSVSFYLQFLKLKNGTVAPCPIKDMGSSVSNSEITRIITKELAVYGIQHNPYIIDFMTLINQLTVKKKRFLVNLVGLVYTVIISGLLFLLGLNGDFAAGIGIFAALLIIKYSPKTTRYLIRAIYIFYKIVFCRFDKEHKGSDHVMFSVSGKIMVKLNEYLLQHSDKKSLIFVDELSINDFIYKLTKYIQKNVSLREKIMMCFVPGYRLKKYFLTEKDFLEEFTA